MVNPKLTAKAFGFRVKEDDFRNFMREELAMKIDGACVAENGKVDMIFINTAMPLDVQTFAYGHELGHAAHAGTALFNDEDLCDRFACKLLAPRRLLREAVKETRTTDPVTLAERFGIPTEFMTSRLIDLGLVEAESVAA